MHRSEVKPRWRALAALASIVFVSALFTLGPDQGGVDAAPLNLAHRTYAPMTARDEPKIPIYLKVVPPVEGVYHSAFPDFSGPGGVTEAKMAAFESLAGKRLAWAYFSNNWIDGIAFPAGSARVIHDAGVVPFIRMMPRSNWDEYKAEPIYSCRRSSRADSTPNSPGGRAMPRRQGTQ